ncbi:MAG: DNA topoisomerase IV [Nonlabens sp.]
MKQCLVLLVCFLLTACYQNTRDCKDYRTGTFKWEQESGGKLLTSTFIRTETLQIETFENVVDTSRVEWINDCEWRAIPINPKSNADSRAYLFKIIQTTDDGYSFEFTQSGRDEVYKATVVKID